MQFNKMILGIDASNIRGGGGVTHLVELLHSAEPEKFSFEKVIVWSGKKTLEQIENKSWLRKESDPLLEKSLLHRIYWQKYKLDESAQKNKCDILFVPGGSYSGGFKPVVTMSQNLLPFEWEEILRYKFSMFSLKLALLFFSQSKTFKRADGIIFLTDYARQSVLKKIHLLSELTTIVNHGINPKFFHTPRIQKAISAYSEKNPYKILYVSFIGEYKHQWNVVQAVGLLRKEDYPVRLELVGSPDEKKALRKLEKSIELYDPRGEFIVYQSKVSYAKIENIYKKADMFVFASSCETFGQILTEAMASGLPIACSEMSAMPEILGDAGVYFNPLDPVAIKDCIKKLIDSPVTRKKFSTQVYKKAKLFTWKKAADETFAFIENTGKGYFTANNKRINFRN